MDALTTGPLPIVTSPSKPILAARPAGRGAHRRPRGGLVGALMEHRGRFASFSVIGGGVFLLGLAMQIALVRDLHMDPVAAFFTQGFVSVQVSFLLNHYWTWRSERVPFWRACWKFNVSKIVTTILNLALYAGLVKAGVNYVVANVATTAVFTVVNYVAGHYWAFSSRTSPAVVAASAADAVLVSLDLDAPPEPWWPAVSVVVPCKDNAATIRGTVDALLGQDYPKLVEVILVGSTNDPTWQALAGVEDVRLTLLEQEPVAGLRDPAVKRDKGARKARGEVIAFADSDIVMDSRWLSRGVAALVAQGGGVAAGGMRSIHDTFWGRFVDRNRLGAKTPRLPEPYMVTAENFGRWNRKPPVTANVVMSRGVYEDQPIDKTWMYGYEDYEWFWRVAKAGHPILFTDALTGRHHHRRSFRHLVTEYRRAAHGCAMFVKKHPGSPLARKRRQQALLLPLMGLAGLAGGGLAVAQGHAVAVAAAMVAGMVFLMGREFIHSRSAESLAYPLAGGTLAVVFTASLSSGLMRMTATGATSAMSDDTPTWTYPSPVVDQPRSFRWQVPAAFMSIFAVGLILRTWELSAKPGWQVDEVTYTSLARNVLLHGTLNLPIAYSQPWTPFLFHPPFYFLLLARWFALVGPGLTQARVLSVIASTVTAVLLARLIHKLHGLRGALVVASFIATDGWLLYVQRISYIENTLFVLVMGAILAYRRALESGSWRWFIVTGILAGAAAIFKHTGVYIIPTLALHWGLTRRHHWKHFALFAIALSIVVAYVLTMLRLFDVNGHNWYLQQTLVQVWRTLGFQQSKGTLASPTAFLHLLTQQYAVFFPSLIVALAGAVWLAHDLVMCVRRRSLSPLGQDTILPAWAITGVVMIGASSLRYAQYFSLVLIPLYSFLWTRLVAYCERRHVPLRSAILGLALVIVAGLASFNLRVLDHNDNTFAQVRTYAWRHIPHSDVVVAESSIAYEIPEPWCSPYGKALTVACLEVARYVITWQTYLQSDNPFNSATLAHLLSRSSPVAKFKGFNGTVTVWKVKK